MNAFLLLCACVGIGYIIRELVRQREVLDTVRWENASKTKLEREDAALELNSLREREWRAIKYIREQMPNFRDDFVWSGQKSADELFISEDNPKNLLWRQQVEELRGIVAPLETAVTKLRDENFAAGIAEITALVRSFQKPTDKPKGNS
jgi:hypothetical protein